MKKIDRTGRRYGRITVVREADHPSGVAWLCRCDCGGEGIVLSTNLGRRGIACPCATELRVKTKRKARHYYPREFHAWYNARNRCFYKRGRKYPQYGGRGITMCRVWRDSFETFLRHMGPCPDGYTLERKDVNGDYKPNNCIWIPASDQALNKRKSLRAGGKPLKNIAEERGINYYTLRMAAKRGEDPLTYIPRGY